jgi:hypothetical protein
MTLVDEFDELEVYGQRRRQHLGMSVIGGDPRKLWLEFRWSFPLFENGRILRLFDLGNRIEDQVVDRMKKMEGLKVSAKDKDGNQYRCSFLGGHLGGSVDGVVKDVDPENPEEVMILEVKSANNNRFRDLQQGESYEEWSKDYSAQIQCYMAAFDLKRALIIVYNKNDSDLYIEIVEARDGILDEMTEKAKLIIQADSPPPSPYSSTDYRIRKFMTPKQQAIYGLEQLPDDINCRNCAHSEPVFDGDGGWRCNNFNKPLDETTQRQGCEQHIWLSSLVSLPIDGIGGGVTTYAKGKVLLTNAPKDQAGKDVYTSKEMRELSKVNYDPEVIKKLMRFREEFGINTRLEELTRDE